MRISLVNTNRMTPPIAPIGLDYLAAACRPEGLDVDVLDLAWAEDADAAIRAHFAANEPDLVGLSFRNVDDSFWPSAAWFVPELRRLVGRIREATDAPVVLGGCGYSIFAEEVLLATGAEFGIRGDGEAALPALARELARPRKGAAPRLSHVPGLVWRDGDAVRENPPAWPARLSIPAGRDALDNAAYFRHGGQLGLETKRGCDGACIFCADPSAKGPRVRCRKPAEVADEVEGLLAAGLDVLHLCDAEFNRPREHALAVCEELIRRGLGGRIRWYGYLSVMPFDGELADAMRRSGCVGINFTAPVASEKMLAALRQPHTKDDLAEVIRLCRERGIAVMPDLMLGSPGETPETVRESIDFLRACEPDCVGAGLGVRLYPGLPLTARILAKAPLESHPGVRTARGPLPAGIPAEVAARPLFRPTYYISPALGPRPAGVVREAIGDDPRFFPPEIEPDDNASSAADGAARDPGDHNYNDSHRLVDAIAAGARGAYWDILRKLP